MNFKKIKDIKFLVSDRFGIVPLGIKNTILLKWNNWNDYGYYTTFEMEYINEQGTYKEIGYVRIGYNGQEEGQGKKKLYVGYSFTELDSNSFSLGSDISYYINLNELEDYVKEFILKGLNDLAYNESFLQQFKDEPVVTQSLLRDISINTVRNQYNRVANGGVALTDYNFFYYKDKMSYSYINFNVIANSNPPTNIHTIIGSNGVGKSYMINNMINSVLDPENSSGKFIFNDYYNQHSDNFSDIIYINFSAFDNFEQLNDILNFEINFNKIGLGNSKELENKYSVIFYNCLSYIINTNKDKLWVETIKHLNSDNVFANINIISILDSDLDDIKDDILNIFENLSSGHKIILLTLTRLVELAQEKTLIFFDEPEMHLHPPLLSSFIRALSHLLINRNSVCIITTHSPIILQEVPSSCVYKYYRFGEETKFERPNIETFGENISVLTNEIFNLELTKSGYYQILENLVKDFNSYEEALVSIQGKLGFEGKAILRSLFFEKNNK